MKHLMKILIRYICNDAGIYAEVKYMITSDSENTHKTLYLILSKDCDSLYYASDENDTEQKLRDAVSEKSFFYIK